MNILKHVKVVVIGEADSFWTKRFIEYVLKPLILDIVLISPHNTTYREYYDSIGIHTYSTYGDSYIDRIPKLNTLLSRGRLLGKVRLKKDAIVIVQYAFPTILQTLKYVDINTLIITYWGSDLYRVSDKELIASEITVRKAKKIVVMTDEMKLDFLCKYKGLDADVVHVVDMGISAFVPISQKINNRIFIRNKLFPECRDKVILTIGYNADSKQQHDRVLQSILQLSDEAKRKIALILPMTYRSTDLEYIKKIEYMLDEMEVSSIVLREFMDDEQVAEVCIATDIFINAQTTDALSSSMLEQLFSGTKVYCGDWLNYGFLDKEGIKYYSFSDFSQLTDRLQNDLSYNQSYFVEGNMEKLMNKCSWATTKQKWENLLNDLVLSN